MKGFIQIIILVVFFESLSFGQKPVETEKKTTQDKNFPGFELKVSDGNKTSSAKVLFISSMTKGLDPSWDISGYGYDEGFHIYTKLIEDNGHNFSVQCLPYEDYSNFSIPIGFNYLEGGMVSFSIKVLNDLSNNYLAIFEDVFTGDFIDLRETGNKYSIELASNSYLSDRFILHTFDPRNKSLDISKMDLKHLNIYSYKNEIYLKGDIKEKCIAEVLTITGKLVFKKIIMPGQSATIISTNLNEGLYIFNLKQNSFNRSLKLFIEH